VTPTDRDDDARIGRQLGLLLPDDGSPQTDRTGPLRAVTRPFTTRKMLPVRYAVKEDDDGRYLTCVEAPNIAVRVERGLSVNPSAARKYPKQTIFLDGAAQAEPFLDTQRSIFNLDHHEGCVRAFTLATCEQAMVLILKGLDLDSEAWGVYANEPDLDTVLAVWLLLNHRRLDGEEGRALRDRMMPIVRLQGVIDAHGLELKELSALPPALERDTIGTINDLRHDELDAKRAGTWGDIDLLDFTLASLQKIDDLVYSPDDFHGLKNVDELARIPIASDRVAVLCRSDVGIYELEEHLREVHGDRLGLILLEKEPGIYTVRQVDPFLSTTLDTLYQRLNFLDPAATKDNRWGGSSDIGGSPRAGGTGLEPRSIANIVRWVYRPPSFARRASALAGAVGACAGVLLVVTMVAAPPEAARAGVVPGRIALAAVLLGVLGTLLTGLGERRFPEHFGLHRPRSSRWLVLLPLTILSALAGGAWLFPSLSGHPSHGAAPWAGVAVVVLAAVGVELLFRGAAFGILATSYPVFARKAGRWFSVPNLVTTMLFTVASIALFAPPQWSMSIGGSEGGIALWVAACLTLGLTCGVAREHSGSVAAPAILHGTSAAIAWWILSFVGG
jgi:hypothetical protein